MVDTNGEAKRNIEIFKKAFNGFINKTCKSSCLNYQKRKAIFDTSWKAYEACLAQEGSYKDKSNKKRKQQPLPINNLPGKSPNIDLNNDLCDTGESDNDDKEEAKIYTRLGLELKGFSS
jgi:hypothetical protein